MGIKNFELLEDRVIVHIILDCPPPYPDTNMDITIFYDEMHKLPIPPRLLDRDEVEFRPDPNRTEICFIGDLTRDTPNPDKKPDNIRNIRKYGGFRYWAESFHVPRINKRIELYFNSWPENSFGDSMEGFHSGPYLSDLVSADHLHRRQL